MQNFYISVINQLTLLAPSFSVEPSGVLKALRQIKSAEGFNHNIHPNEKSYYRRQTFWKIYVRVDLLVEVVIVRQYINTCPCIVFLTWKLIFLSIFNKGDLLKIILIASSKHMIIQKWILFFLNKNIISPCQVHILFIYYTIIATKDVLLRWR